MGVFPDPQSNNIEGLARETKEDGGGRGFTCKALGVENQQPGSSRSFFSMNEVHVFLFVCFSS